MGPSAALIMVTMVIGLPVLGLLTAALLQAGKRRHQVRVQQLQVLQRALEHPALDERTRADLTRLLADDHRRKHGPLGVRVGRWLRVGHVLLLACGWLLLIGGIGFWIASDALELPSRNTQPAIAAMIVGIALVTLPLALRELLGRRERKPATSES